MNINLTYHKCYFYWRNVYCFHTLFPNCVKICIFVSIFT